MTCQAAHTPDINAFTDDGSSRGRVARHNNASRSDASTFSILHAQRNVPNAMAQPLDDALSKCVLRPGALGWLQLKLARTRPGALSTDRGVRVQPPRAEISPFDLLVGDAAVCMSAGRPSFDSSLAMTQTTCAARAAVPTTLANSIGNCSALRSKSIWLAMLGALSVDSASQ
jgi:hypothetical protein